MNHLSKRKNRRVPTDKEKVHIRNYTLQSSFASMNMHNTTPPPQCMNIADPPSPPKLVHRFLPGSQTKAGVFEKLIVNNDGENKNVNGDNKRKSNYISYLPSYLSGKSDTHERTAVTPTFSHRSKRKKVSWTNEDEIINDAISSNKSNKKGDKKDWIHTHHIFLGPIKPSAIDEEWSADYKDMSHEGNNKGDNDLW